MSPSHPLRSCLLAVVLLVSGLVPLAVFAQESSIITLGEPEGPSSGEVLGDEVPAGESAAEDAAPIAPPPPCGRQPITMARMQWPSSALLAEIHARLLTAHFACEVRVQESDMATVASSMGANGQPAVAPEMWVTRIAEIWNAAIQGQNVRQGGSSYADQVFEGWFVPDYAVEAMPELITIDGLKAQAGALGTGRPRFISCPIDWGCNLINRNLLRAHGLDQVFEIVEPGNRFEFDTLIAEAVSRREPIVFYYWRPNAILAQFAFQSVELGAYDKDNFLCLGRTACASPQPTGFAPDPVIIAVAEWVYLDAPQVASYFQRARMPFAEMNAMLLQLSEPGASVETVAERFVADRGAVWRPWVGLTAEPEAESAAPAQ